MTVEVRDETGTNGALATTVTDTLTAAIPVIEKVTELPLPRCTFRLVTPRVWRSEVRAYVRRTSKAPSNICPAAPRGAKQNKDAHRSSQQFPRFGRDAPR